MEARIVNTPSAALDNEPARCFFAIELSKTNWLVAAQGPAGNVSRYQLPGCDANALLELIERIRARVKRETGRPVEMVSCYEAGYDGFWLHRFLVARGVRNCVIDPASLQVDRRARRAKTDRIDAERLQRERHRLVAERVQHVNRIKSLCALQGIYDYQPLRPDRMERLDHLRTGNGQALPVRLKAEIERELERLQLVLEMIVSLEAERNAITKDKAPTAHLHADKIRKLVRLKAIGPEFSTALVGEVFYRQFANRRQIGSYVGLTPSPFSSGAIARDQGISKAGNPKARTMMIELAWMWRRHQPGSALTVWFNERVGNLKGRPRRIAIVAMARKLLVALWRYLETGLVPTGAVLKA